MRGADERTATRAETWDDSAASHVGAHAARVARIAVALATRLGYRGDELDAIEVGALLHDIGKVGIPESILLKPGPLDEPEWRIMRVHPVISDSLLAPARVHPIVREIARSSHERLDGGGYPDGLLDAAIPVPARIVAVADAFDALTSDRAYRDGRPVASALVEVRRHAGTQFCPRVVAALDAVARETPNVLIRAPLASVA